MAIQHLPPPETREGSRAPATRPSPPRATRAPARRSALLVDLGVLLGLVGVIWAIAVAAARWTGPLEAQVAIDLAPTALPGYALASLTRMAAAYALSLAFSLTYGYLAASGPRAERVLLPVLDILQSVPILSFMPGVVLALVALFPRANAGLELAAILLIFTSQAWNLTFSFYQSLRTIPAELHEAAVVYHLDAWRRFTRLELPFATIGLIWNSMMSWAGGWFFLIAAEQFTLGDHDFRLPGLGSYLKTAADRGDGGALALGLGTLVLVIVLLDQLVWRPLVAWAEKFRVEETPSSQPATSRVLTALRRSRLVEWLSERVLPRLGTRIDRLASRLVPAPPTNIRPAGGRAPGLRARAGNALLVLVSGGAIVWGAIALAQLVLGLDAADWLALIPATAATLLRTTVALIIATLWTVPLGVLIGLHPTWARRVQPLVQIAASIPATALFPVLLLLVLGLPGGLNIAAVVLMLLGTQWYLLFNVIAGAQAIPSDLRDASTVFQLDGWRRWRYLILPGIFPYLVTGLITATGGAWNASVVAEYVTFGGQTFAIVGLGALIAQAAYDADYARLAAGTIVMAAVVVAINRLLWRRLYAAAESRYRLD